MNLLIIATYAKSLQSS